MKKVFLYIVTFCCAFIASYIGTSEVLLQPPEADSVEKQTFPSDEDISDLPMSTGLCRYTCIEGTIIPDVRDWPVTKLDDEEAVLTIKALMTGVRGDYALWYSRYILESFIAMAYEDRQAIRNTPSVQACLYVSILRFLNQYQEEKNA